MRKIARLGLTSRSREVLAVLQALVDKDPSAVDAVWRRRTSGKNRRAAFQEVRRILKRMARGRTRCMYCEDSEGTDIDHHRPKKKYPHNCFSWPNYLLACSHCNSNEKRDQYPLDAKGKPLLLDPTVDDPYEHIAFVPETGQFQGITPRGASTVAVFGLNRRQTLEQGRRNAWTELSALLRDYAQAVRANDSDWQDRVIQAIRDLSFQSVVQHYLRDAMEARETVPPAVSALILNTKQVWQWAL